MASSPIGSNVEQLWGFIESAGTSLLDLILFKDSNGLFNSRGYDHGWQAGLLAAGFTMYATGLHSLRENGGQGQRVGYGDNSIDAIAFRPSGLTSTGTECPQALLDWWDHELDPRGGVGEPLLYNHFRHTFVRDGSGTFGITGLTLYPQCPLGQGGSVADQLQYQAWFGYFNSADGGDGANAQVRWLQGPDSSTVRNVTVTTGGADPTGVFVAEVDLPVAGYSGGLMCRIQSATLPHYSSGQRIVRKNDTRGFAVSSFYSVGGADIDDCADYLDSAGESRVGNYLEMVTHQQRKAGQAERALAVFTYGTNNEAGAMTDAEYKSDAERAIAALQGAWAAKGYDPMNLHILLLPSHPQSADDNKIDGYRQACFEIAEASGGRISYLNLAEAVPFAVLDDDSAVPRFASGGDTNHLYTASTAEDSYTEVIRSVMALAEQIVASSITDPGPEALAVTHSDKVAIIAEIELDGGQVYTNGNLQGIVTHSAAVGEIVTVQTRGVYDLLKGEGEVFGAGDPVHWDTSARRAVASASSSTTQLGCAIEDLHGYVRTLIK